MGGSAEVSGPDLSEGIESSQLSGDGMLLGHSGDEGVLLVRRNDELFAVGASCTHYSAPLVDGLVVDDTVRCPWHHGSFSLRTGEALRAPACAGLDVWRVEERGGRIRVLEKTHPTTRRHAAGAPASVVIIGAGAAGNSAAEQLRKEGYAGRIVMITREDGVPYDKPNISKDYLAGKAPEEWIPLHSDEHYSDRRIELMTKREVVAIDRAAKKVRLDGDESIDYDVLVVATGADPRRLTVPGADRPHVRTLRTLNDSRGIIAAVEKSKRVVVVGASFIGLEVAASLRERGAEVTVVAPETVPLERVLGKEVGTFLRALHEQHGVRFRLGHVPAEVTDDAVRLDDGEIIPADLVVVGVGVTPATKLADAAGLTVDNGIVVDEFLRTSDENIFAVGDLARWPDSRSGESMRVEHWVVAGRQGQTVARNILGRRERFDAVPFFWSAHYDITLAYVGYARVWDDVKIDGSLEASDATVVYRSAGKIVAVATLFRDKLSLEVEAAMERGDLAALEKLLGSK